METINLKRISSHMSKETPKRGLISNIQDLFRRLKMQELGPVLRALELQKLIEDKVTEWRERSTRVAGSSVADSYQQPVNFRRKANRRKNSSEIDRIIEKYSKTNQPKRTDESYFLPRLIELKQEKESAKTPVIPPQRPARQRKCGSNWKLSRSEDNLSSIGMSDNPDPVKPPRRFKYNAKSCEDITEFVDVGLSKRSKNFEQNSILNAKPVPNERPKLCTISEDKSFIRESSPDFVFRTKSEFATSTPISKRNTCHLESLNDYDFESENFEKCTKYSSVSDLRHGISEPDILSVCDSVDSKDATKALAAKKRWKFLKQPFRKGSFDVILRWRGKKSRPEKHKM